ncbi:uncharacterized protein LOC121733442 [Aricia agestis]|uniref:uncharacterized protein LOC121733442 n=1 Tax=Aricia agestis TaxID=91739 RepID=UPI001C207129|nr:uncharacterized protein LOC121733442 [Aricia agestis]
MKTSLLLLLAVIHASVAYPSGPPHPAVVAVRHEEEQLPPHLRKPAIFNPRVHAIISLTSLLHHGENLVYDREADKVPRHEIYKILTHAGFLARQKLNHGPQYNPYSPDFEAQFLHNPELLQYL